MNRKQRRDLKFKRSKGTNLNDPEQAQELLEIRLPQSHWL